MLLRRSATEILRWIGKYVKFHTSSKTNLQPSESAGCGVYTFSYSSQANGDRAHAGMTWGSRDQPSGLQGATTLMSGLPCNIDAAEPFSLLEFNPAY